MNYGVGRLTITEKQRTSYAKDMKTYNNTLADRASAKYDVKIAKADARGNNIKVARLREKQEEAVARQKAIDEYDKNND